MPVVASAKTSGHRSMRHTVSKTSDNPSQPVSHRPAFGPATIKANDSSTNSTSAMVKAMATRRTFHHGRVSGMSYALLSADTIEVIAPELLHSAPRMPMVRMLGASPPTMLSS